MNNSMKDEELANIFESLEKSRGLKGLGVIENNIGQKASEEICKYIESDSFFSIRKFILKDP